MAAAWKEELSSQEEVHLDEAKAAVVDEEAHLTVRRILANTLA